MATRKPMNIPAPPSDGVGMVCTLRGPGIATAPMRGATHRTTKVARNVTIAAAPATVRYPGKSSSEQVRVGDEAAAELGGLGADVVGDVVVVDLAQHLRDQ